MFDFWGFGKWDLFQTGTSHSLISQKAERIFSQKHCNFGVFGKRSGVPKLSGGSDEDEKLQRTL